MVHEVLQAATAAGLLGLGAVLLDRGWPTAPRPVRWALGMALRSLVPICMVWHLALSRAPGRTTTPEMALVEFCASLPACLAAGLVFGWAARSSRGLLWKLPLAGLFYGLWVWIAIVAMYGSSAWLRNWRPLGAYLLPGFPYLPEYVAFGPLLGLALAERLEAAPRHDGTTD